MKWFYKIIIFMTDFELQIAQSTGRNKRDVDQLKQDLKKWEGDYHRYLVRTN